MKPAMPPIPDPVPLREALRGLRHVLRNGGETLVDTMPLSIMPGGASPVARGARRAGEGVARNVDRLASGVARWLFSSAPVRFEPLDELAARGESAAGDFGRLAYLGLTEITKSLGVRHAFVSEAAAFRAWREAMSVLDHAADTPRIAEVLYLALLSERVVRYAQAAPVAEDDEAAGVPCATFALLLWLLYGTSREVSGDDRANCLATLEQSRAIPRARAQCTDIARAASVQNGTRLRQLFSIYMPS